MQMKNKNIPIEKKTKNKLSKNKILISNDSLKKKFPNEYESEKEKLQSNNQYNKMLNILFDENKFNIRNEFDRKHCKEFLKEKFKYLQPMNLDDSVDEKVGNLNRLSSKFTFGNQ